MLLLRSWHDAGIRSIFGLPAISILPIETTAMEGEDSHATETSVLSRPLGWIASCVLRFPRFTIGCGLALAAISLIYAGTTLTLRTNRLDLLNPNSSFNKLWLEFIHEFGEEDDAVVVVEGKDRAAVVAALDLLAAEIAHRQRSFHAVLHKVDLEKIRSKQLHYLSADELTQVDGFLNRMQPVLDGDWSQFNLGRSIGMLAGDLAAQDANLQAALASALPLHVQNLKHLIAGDGQYVSPWAPLDPLLAEKQQLEPQYVLAAEGRMGLILLRLADEEQSFTHSSRAIDELRELLAQFSGRHAEVKVGLTGLPVMENDEMRSNQTSSLQSSLISFVAVSILFVAGLGGIRHPLLAVSTISVSFAWAIGYLTLAVGHLNILSMSFSAILIGLGVDFGIHYVTRYLQLREQRQTCEEALLNASYRSGPGILAAGVTTSIAFFAAALTQFTGIVELGIISGGGVMLAALAALVMLPAVILLSDRNRPHVAIARPLAFDRAMCLPLRTPVATMIAAVGFVAFCALGLQHLQFDHNLLHMQPLGLESVRLEQHLLDESDQSVWYALSIADSPEELLARKARFQQLDSVERTEEIVSILPKGQHATAPAIAQIAHRLRLLPQFPPTIPVVPPSEIGAALSAAAAGGNVQPASIPGGQELFHVLAMLADMPAADSYRCLAQYQQRLADDLLKRLRTLASISNPEPPDMNDLPPSLVERFVGHNGKHLLKIYSKSDIWDMDALANFVAQVRQVDPRATGKPLQTYEASRQLQQSYIHAALYALLGVSMMLVIDFGSIRYTLLALVPVALGMLQMFGIMGLLDLPLNAANMVVLPLILGIGIDNGVHVIHEFRCRQRNEPYRLGRTLCTAMLLNTLTTMAGFGSMMVAEHRGLQSLGRVLTLGVGCCFFTAVVPLPALLAWRTRQEGARPAGRPAIESPPAEPIAARHDLAA